MPRAAMQFLQ